MPEPVAQTLGPLVRALLGTESPVAIRFWDGSSMGPDVDLTDGPHAAVLVRSPDAIRRLLYAPNELGLARAYVVGDLDIDGDVYTALSIREALADPHDRVDFGLSWLDRLKALGAARKVGAFGRPLPPPEEEARLGGRLHSKARDEAAIAHHYDVGNDFYRLVLGPTYTYSCAYFATADGNLDDAQRAKYDLICRKLGLKEGMRLLDVGCGWGGMVLHAAEHYGVRAVGITLSREQHALATQRVADAGLAGRVEVRVQDYRDVDDGPFDAISSIGMFEHVGMDSLNEYFTKLYSLLPPEGRLLNHGISRPAGPSPIDTTSFIARYVFPDGGLHEVGTVVSAMQGQGFEVRDVESLREHYALTLRSWVRNLEANWDEAQALVGPRRARIWRLYMAACARNFEAGRTSIHQVLGVRRSPVGASGIPLRREEWLTSRATN
ncbi:MAG TPA: cyclopropane-fatty-acyl-phospholipid synthase family protein [Acidimicrobiales bacterium]|nr:cyclopropane-fatty-acyl-phospholipid synthase family protein [Acidimicrobiales bacterium]